MEGIRKADSIGGEVDTEPFLPEDLVFAEILPRLPVKSLMKFKCVSKNWTTRVSCDSFIDAHLRQQLRNDQPALVFYREYRKRVYNPIGQLQVKLHSEQWSKEMEVASSYLPAEDSSFKIVGSCHGLICLNTLYMPKRVLLWNPATRKLRQLPEAPRARDGIMTILGFGSDGKSKEFKVVMLIFSCNSNFSRDWPLVRSQVFSKSGTVWRDSRASGIVGRPYDMNAVAAEGSLHWVLYRNNAPRGVLSFDLSSEVLRFDEGPSDCIGFSLCRWRSSLAAFGMCDLWTASSSGDGLSWSKIMKFKSPMHVELSSLVWREQFVGLMVMNPACPESGWTLSIVDPKNGVVRILEEAGPCEVNFVPYCACNYVESFLTVF